MRVIKTTIKPTQEKSSDCTYLDELQNEAIMNLRQGTKKMQSNIQEMARILKAANA